MQAKTAKESDMKRFRMVGLCLIVVIGIPAVISSSASAALPEVSGPFPKPFKSKSGIITVETIHGTKASCKAGTNTGEITGAKTGTVTLKATGCEAVGLKCTSEGAGEGEIVSKPLSARLGYINKAKKEVGISLESATGGLFVEFKCGPVKVTESGSVISKITPVNKNVKTFKLLFTQIKGKQKPNKFEGGPIDVLMTSVAGGPPEEAGVAAKVEVTFPQAVDIKA
jgi:hypothetical protein